jgi:hypothetical protein
MLSGMQTKKPKRPRDPNQLGKLIVALSVGEEAEANVPASSKDPAAVALGRKGGAARAATLKPLERSKIALKAAKVRWAKNRKTKTK